VAFVAATVTTQAQTYYYYPSSANSGSVVTTGGNSAPAYYYRRGLFGWRYVWAGYSTPYSYQTANSPQTTQAADQAHTVTQAPAVQTRSDAQVIQTGYTTPEPQPAATTAAASTDAGDPYGFTGWLNATRASYGLPAVGHDPNLSSWAAENNNHQAARGMGHFVMGPARRQNAAFGDVSNIGAMWMASPAHRAALLDPTIRWIGIAGLGAYWTFNAN
jgi:uncharacterized protein YkwD